MSLFRTAARQRALYIGIILLGIGLDQLAKALAVAYLKPIDTQPLWQDVLHLTYLENRGAAFGMLANDRWVFMVFSTLAILGLAVYLFWRTGKDVSLLSGISLAMIISGGIGNMIDRIALGYVVDFIDFRLINFAVFNGADSFVCVGAGILILSLVLELIAESKKNKTT